MVDDVPIDWQTLALSEQIGHPDRRGGAFLWHVLVLPNGLSSQPPNSRALEAGLRNPISYGGLKYRHVHIF